MCTHMLLRLCSRPDSAAHNAGPRRSDDDDDERHRDAGRTATLRFDGYDDSAVVPLSQIRPPRPAQSDAVGSAEEGAEGAGSRRVCVGSGSGGLGPRLGKARRRPPPSHGA